jgi:hypothetical protein
VEDVVRPYIALWLHIDGIDGHLFNERLNYDHDVSNSHGCSPSYRWSIEGYRVFDLSRFPSGASDVCQKAHQPNSRSVGDIRRNPFRNLRSGRVVLSWSGIAALLLLSGFTLVVGDPTSIVDAWCLAEITRLAGIFALGI